MHSYTKVSVLFICAKIEQGLLKKKILFSYIGTSLQERFPPKFNSVK